MPIENLEYVKQTNALVSQATLFQSNNVIVAGTLKVKHSLMDMPLVLVGFVVEDISINENDFKVKGNTIYYSTNKLSSADYVSRNIYPKIIIDGKLNHISNYFKEDYYNFMAKDRDYIAFIKDDKLFTSRTYKYEWASWSYDFNKYYLFDDISATIPETAANVILALCKYREDGVFKHAIFNLHEITPDL